MNLNVGKGSAGSLGIEYVIQDNTRVQSSSTTKNVIETLDGLFIIHANKGIPNVTFSNMTLANFEAMFGEVNKKKHGIQAAAARKLAKLGHTVTVCRLDKGAKIANLYSKAIFEAEEKEVYLYGGLLFNVTESVIDAGGFDSILEKLGTTATHFKTTAKKVTIPVIKGSVSNGSFPGITSVEDLVVEAENAFDDTNAGNLGIKTREIILGTFHATGGGSWGKKITATLGEKITTRNKVPTRSISVAYNGKNATVYSAIGLVPNRSDENAIQLFLGTKLKDKEVIANYIGDLNLRYFMDETNETGLENLFIDYFRKLIVALQALDAANDAEILSGNGDATLKTELVKAVGNYTTIAELLEDGDIHPMQILNWDGTSVFDMTNSYNLIKLDSNIFPTTVTLAEGDDGVVKGMRKFSYEHGEVDNTVADMYESYFKFEIDPTLKDITEVRSVITFNFDYPTKVRNAIYNATKHETNKRGDILVVGGTPETIKTYDDLLEYGKALKLSESNYLLLAGTCDVFDEVMNENIKVSTVYPFLDALSSWYKNGRRNPLTDYAMGSIVRGSLYPRIIDGKEIDALYELDVNLLKVVDGIHKLKTQSVGDVGKISKLKEAQNAINFRYLIKDVHNAVEKYQKGVGDGTTLTEIQEKISKELEKYGAYFQGAPIVSLAFLDEDAEVRGEADLSVEVNMYGSIKKFSIKFIVNSASATE